MRQRIKWTSEMNSYLISQIKKHGVAKGSEIVAEKFGTSVPSVTSHYYHTTPKEVVMRISKERSDSHKFVYDPTLVKIVKECVAKHPDNYSAAFREIASITGYSVKTITKMWYGYGKNYAPLRDTVGPVTLTVSKNTAMENRKCPRTPQSISGSKRTFTHIFSIITKALKLYKNDPNKTGKASKEAKS